jgi:molybdopterin/thiamine biosynthesis adenylyltransferase
MRTIESPEGFRNMGFWNDATQQALLDTNVAIGGVGGAGYLTGIELAHMGVQNFAIADPEPFEDVNSNRVLGAREDTYGYNKAEVFRDEILKINSGANVRAYSEGINAGNVRDFMSGADVVVDALELSMPELGTAVAREARKLGIFVVNAEYVAHGAQVTTFDPKSKTTFERFMGIKGGEEAPLEDVAEQKVATDRFLAYIPPYADLATLEALDKGAPLPSNMIGAGVAAQLAVSEVLKIARLRVGERSLPPTIAPSVRWMDAYNGDSGKTNHPRLSFYRHLAKAVVRNKLGLNEEASYREAERAARGDVG